MPTKTTHFIWSEKHLSNICSSWMKPLQNWATSKSCTRLTYWQEIHGTWHVRNSMLCVHKKNPAPHYKFEWKTKSCTESDFIVENCKCGVGFHFLFLVDWESGSTGMEVLQKPSQIRKLSLKFSRRPCFPSSFIFEVRRLVCLQKGFQKFVIIQRKFRQSSYGDNESSVGIWWYVMCCYSTSETCTLKLLPAQN